jgi:hypothetical protein
MAGALEDELLVLVWNACTVIRDADQDPVTLFFSDRVRC